MKSKFIVFEGLDGCGSTTQMQLFASRLRIEKKKFIITQEPSVSFIGNIIKKTLKGHIETPPLALQMLFTADRSHHLANEIEPALKKRKHVLCDRYIFSTIAFGSLDIDSWFLTQLNRYFLTPDIIIYLKVPVKECIRRIKHRGLSKEIFEEEKKLKKIGNMYDFLAQRNKTNTLIINGANSKEEVSKEIWEKMKRRI